MPRLFNYVNVDIPAAIIETNYKNKQREKQHV